MCSPIEKAELLNRHFDSKQCRDGVLLSPTCHPMPQLSSFAFRSSEVKGLLRNLNSYGGTDPLGFFPLFYKNVCQELALKLAVIFTGLVRCGEFPLFSRTANVVPVPKDALSPDVANYCPISLTPIISKIFERLITTRFGRCLEASSVFPPCQFAYRKGRGSRDLVLLVMLGWLTALNSQQKIVFFSSDVSGAFDKVETGRLMEKLKYHGLHQRIIDLIF